MSEKPTYEELEKRVQEFERAESERRRTADVLKEGNRFFNDILESIQDGICILSTDLKIIHVNRVMKTWYADKLPLEGKHCFFCFRNSDQPCEPCPSLRSIHSGLMERDVVPGLPGSPVKWVELFSYPIKDPESGAVTSIVEFVRDITVRKEAEEALRKSEAHLKSIFRAAPTGIGMIVNRVIKEANERLCEMTGYRREELIGKSARMIYPADKDFEFVGKEKYKQIRERGTGTVETRFQRKDGKIIDVLLSSTPVNPEDLSAGVTFTALDITERTLLEEQLRQSAKMEAIGTLAGGIAHDFNNILASVIGYAELAIDDVEKGSLLEQNLQEVLTAGNRARELVKQILVLSRHDTVDFKPIHIVPMVKEAVKMLRSIIPASIEIKETICNKQLVVHADPTQIHQVIVNLVTNAKHAMSETGGVMVIGVDSVSLDENTETLNLPPGNYARITVSDTGSGINREHLEKIFEPYFTTKEIGKGSGLGLSVVHGIVRSHKGDIAVHSQPGKGTTFTIYLPLAEHQSVEYPFYNAEEISGGTERILVVDDELPIVKMLHQMMEQLGYKVTSCNNSMKALEMFNATPDKFDLIITDMTMPNMTGDKLAKAIKKIRPEVRVILCTGFSDTINIQTGPDLQIDGFLKKPLNKKKLADTVRKVLDGPVNR